MAPYYLARRSSIRRSPIRSSRDVESRRTSGGCVAVYRTTRRLCIPFLSVRRHHLQRHGPAPPRPPLACESSTAGSRLRRQRCRGSRVLSICPGRDAARLQKETERTHERDTAEVIWSAVATKLTPNERGDEIGERSCEIVSASAIATRQKTTRLCVVRVRRRRCVLTSHRKSHQRRPYGSCTAPIDSLSSCERIPHETEAIASCDVFKEYPHGYQRSIA